MAAVRTDIDELRTRLAELRRETRISPEIADIRLALMRVRDPNAVVLIDVARADDTAIAVRATTGFVGGAMSSHIAARDVADGESWSDQMAMVQAEAICVALDALQPRTSAHTEPQSTAAQKQPRPAVSEEDHLPEYSWNAFWQTMNAKSITREQVEQTLGKSVQEATPKEAVDALTSAGLID